MGSTSFTYKPRQDSDANFNLWANRFSTALSDAGMVQTADTGQTSFTGSPTITRPGTNTSAGYQIWRLPTAIAGSPGGQLYFKFGFGTGGASNQIGVFLTVGTDTDGAGNLTGAVGEEFEMYSSSTANSTVGGPCFFSCGDWGLWWAFGIGAQTSTYSNFSSSAGLILRSIDSTGAPTNQAFFHTSAQGCTVVSANSENNPPWMCVNIATGRKYGASVQPSSGTMGTFAFLPCPPPGNEANNSWIDPDTGDAAVFPCFGVSPHPFPLPVNVGWVDSFPTYTVSTATPVGTTQRNYLSLSTETITGFYPFMVDETFQSDVRFLLIWE